MFRDDRWLCLTFALLCLLAMPGRKVQGCPFCSTQGQTLSGEVSQADFIVLGRMTNAQRDLNDLTKGTTELIIDSVIKPHPYLVGRKSLQIPRYVAPSKEQTQYLVFCSLYTRLAEFPATAIASAAILGNYQFAQLDPYRGEPVPPDSRMAEYLKGAIAVRDADPVKRLRFFFDYLDASDLVISTDALMEFGNSDYKEVRQLAANLPAERILGWLTDPNTPPSRLGLYGLLIGHCGKPADAVKIRAILDDPNRMYSSGLDGIIAGYIMLDRKAGWEYLLGLLKDTKKDFPVRYAGLKVLRFFWEYRPDIIEPAEVLEAMKILVAQPDIADLPIEDLRKWGRWELADYILQFDEKESHHKIPIVRRAILRYALSVPGNNPRAAAYVAAARKSDPERVEFVEQMLKEEQPRPATTATGGRAAPSGGS